MTKNRFSHLTNREKSMLTLFSYISTFVISRFIVFLVESNTDLPLIGYNTLFGFHIHHFAYGIIILIVLSFISLFFSKEAEHELLFILYGISLGLIFDEFGIWLKLDPQYNQLISFVAVFFVSVVLFMTYLLEKRYPHRFSSSKTRPLS